MHFVSSYRIYLLFDCLYWLDLYGIFHMLTPIKKLQCTVFGICKWSLESKNGQAIFLANQIPFVLATSQSYQYYYFYSHVPCPYLQLKYTFIGADACLPCFFVCNNGPSFVYMPSIWSLLTHFIAKSQVLYHHSIVVTDGRSNARQHDLVVWWRSAWGTRVWYGCPYYDGAFDLQQVRLCRDNGAVEYVQVLVNKVI
jgi:hypothetical protein